MVSLNIFRRIWMNMSYKDRCEIIDSIENKPIDSNKYIELLYKKSCEKTGRTPITEEKEEENFYKQVAFSPFNQDFLERNWHKFPEKERKEWIKNFESFPKVWVKAKKWAIQKLKK